MAKPTTWRRPSGRSLDSRKAPEVRLETKGASRPCSNKRRLGGKRLGAADAFKQFEFVGVEGFADAQALDLAIAAIKPETGRGLCAGADQVARRRLRCARKPCRPELFRPKFPKLAPLWPGSVRSVFRPAHDNSTPVAEDKFFDPHQGQLKTRAPSRASRGQWARLAQVSRGRWARLAQVSRGRWARLAQVSRGRWARLAQVSRGRWARLAQVSRGRWARLALARRIAYCLDDSQTRPRCQSPDNRRSVRNMSDSSAHGNGSGGGSQEGRPVEGRPLEGRRFERINFLAANTPEAQHARARLVGRYGDVHSDEADVVVALGGDGLMLQTLHRFHGPQRADLRHEPRLGRVPDERISARPVCASGSPPAQSSLIHPLIMVARKSRRRDGDRSRDQRGLAAAPERPGGQAAGLCRRPRPAGGAGRGRRAGRDARRFDRL